MTKHVKTKGDNMAEKSLSYTADANDVIVNCKCETCDEVASENLVILVYDGMPICPECIEEMIADTVFVTHKMNDDT